MKTETEPQRIKNYRIGPSRCYQRDDAIWHAGREYVPTTPDTRYVNGDWSEFVAAGGIIHFNEDQTEIVLTVPEGVKFGIKFMDKDSHTADLTRALKAMINAFTAGDSVQQSVRLAAIEVLTKAKGAQ